MFISHLAAGDKIFVQVDSDVDGYTSAAAIINYANMFAPGHAQRNISYRIHDGKEHGIILDTIPEDIKLLIVPDAGSNDYEQHIEENYYRRCDSDDNNPYDGTNHVDFRGKGCQRATGAIRQRADNQSLAWLDGTARCL